MRNRGAHSNEFRWQIFISPLFLLIAIYLCWKLSGFFYSIIYHQKVSCTFCWQFLQNNNTSTTNISKYIVRYACVIVFYFKLWNHTYFYEYHLNDTTKEEITSVKSRNGRILTYYILLMSLWFVDRDTESK